MPVSISSVCCQTMRSPPRSRTGRVLSRWEITNKLIDKTLFKLSTEQLWSVLGGSGLYCKVVREYSYLKRICIRRRAKYIFILKTLSACHAYCESEADMDSRVFAIRWARSVIASASTYCQ